jgi:hypothetical protein
MKGMILGESEALKTKGPVKVNSSGTFRISGLFLKLIEDLKPVCLDGYSSCLWSSMCWLLVLQR